MDIITFFTEVHENFQPKKTSFSIKILQYSFRTSSNEYLKQDIQVRSDQKKKAGRKRPAERNVICQNVIPEVVPQGA